MKTKSKISNLEIEKMLFNEAQNITPDVLEKVKQESKYVQVANEETQNNVIWKNVFSIKKLAITFICLLIITFSITSITVYGSEVETISLDVNPSIELVLNRFNKVIKINMNDDAKEIINSKDLKNKKIEEAIITCYDAIVQAGYLESNSENMIILSGYNKNKEYDCSNLDSLYAILQSENKKNEISCLIIENNVNKTLKEIADDNDLSLGQMKLIQEIYNLDQNSDFNTLKNYSMKELKEYYAELLEKNLEGEISEEDTLEDLYKKNNNKTNNGNSKNKEDEFIEYVKENNGKGNKDKENKEDKGNKGNK